MEEEVATNALESLTSHSGIDSDISAKKEDLSSDSDVGSLDQNNLPLSTVDGEKVTSSDNAVVKEPPTSTKSDKIGEEALEEPASSSQEKDIEGKPDVDMKNEEGQGDSCVKAPKRRMSVITISDTDSESNDSSDVCLVDSYQASASEAKRLRRGYSTSESDSASSEEDVISDEENPTVVVSEAPSMLSKLCSVVSQRAPRDVPASFNPNFKETTLTEIISQHWKSEEDYESSDVTLTKDPFRVCVLNEFLENANIIHNIIDDMTTLDWSRRKMDLYEFHRSSDLANLSWQRTIKSFYDLLKDHVINWIAEITKLKLTHVSASCALYGPGDHLLVHDDLMTDRKVAFIYYLSPWISNAIEGNETQSDQTDNSKSEDGTKNSQFQWTESMGGALQLLATDKDGLPTEPVKSIYPNNNSFAFFKVGSNTFHQVSEVLTYDYPRLTINGWFHGPPEETEPTPQHVEVVTPILYKDLKEAPHSDLFQSLLSQWITSNYLSPRTKYKIQQQIESTSEISLEDFFINNIYDTILAELSDSDLSWSWKGPANLQHFETLNLDSAGESTKQLQKLFSSEHFIKLLSEFTDLRLSSYHSLEIQRWSAGSYTVIPPLNHSLVTELDVILYLGVPDKKISGGSTVYLAPEEAESIPLITIEPLNNSLNIVYSDAGTTRFTKYINRLGFNKEDYFYIVTCSYRE